MKAKTFLKALIVLVAIGVIVYIIHNSNKAAEINNLISAPVEQYEFTQRVDSMCDTIRNASNFSRAKQVYHKLYEEIEVYSAIKKNTGEALLDMSACDQLYENAVNAYWPTFSNEADDLFAKTDWNPSQDFKKEVTYLLKCKGADRTQKDAIKKYNGYISGRSNFAKLLKNLESCTNATTYNTLSDLDDYDDYPYSKLSAMQTRRSKAESKARASWTNYLNTSYGNIRQDGVDKLNQSSVSWDDVKNFSNRKNEWANKVYSYQNTVPGQEDAFYSELRELDELYESLLDKNRSWDPSNYEIPTKFRQYW